MKLRTVCAFTPGESTILLNETKHLVCTINLKSKRKTEIFFSFNKYLLIIIKQIILITIYVPIVDIIIN